MSRIHGALEDGDQARINEKEVSRFFERRAQRIPELGPTRAVIYQDKHPDLAERRDQHERAMLTPKLRLDGSQRLLDVGCGTGRWTTTLGKLLSHYHGIDFATGLVEHARVAHGSDPHTRFSVSDAANFSLDQLNEAEAFDRALVSGVLIYLNDDALLSALRCVDQATTSEAVILMREPVSQANRLTLVDHHSVELDADYNAIYRTRAELMGAAREAFAGTGRVLIEHGYVYDDPKLNNRSETRQEWFLFYGVSMSSTAFCFDLDGTLSSIEILPAIAAEIGIAEEVETLTRVTMDGHVSFAQSLRLRALLLGSVPIEIVHRVVADLPLNDDLTSFIAAHADSCFVVTGNLDVWLAPITQRLACPVLASRASRRAGHLRVDEVMDKGGLVRNLRTRGFGKVIAVGDGANDVPMLRESEVGIAFGGVHSPTRSAVEAADYVVHEGGDLCRLLEGLS